MQLLEGSEGSVAVGLFSELAKGHFSLEDAAVMVALNLFGDQGPSPRVMQYLSEAFAERYVPSRGKRLQACTANERVVQLSR